MVSNYIGLFRNKEVNFLIFGFGNVVFLRDKRGEKEMRFVGLGRNGGLFGLFWYFEFFIGLSYILRIYSVYFLFIFKK